MICLKKIGFLSLLLCVFAIFHYYGWGLALVAVVMSCVQFHSYHRVSSL